MIKIIFLFAVAGWLTYDTVTTLIESNDNTVGFDLSEQPSPPVSDPNASKSSRDLKTLNLPDLPPTSILFETTEWDFGEIKLGETINHVFKFTNTGPNPLVIHKTTASCGCTIPTYSKEPVAPGEQGEIMVTYDSGKSTSTGVQKKTITVTANTEPFNQSILVKGTVTE